MSHNASQDGGEAGAAPPPTTAAPATTAAAPAETRSVDDDTPMPQSPVLLAESPLSPQAVAMQGGFIPADAMAAYTSAPTAVMHMMRMPDGRMFPAPPPVRPPKSAPLDKMITNPPDVQPQMMYHSAPPMHPPQGYGMYGQPAPWHPSFGYMMAAPQGMMLPPGWVQTTPHVSGAPPPGWMPAPMHSRSAAEASSSMAAHAMTSQHEQQQHAGLDQRHWVKTVSTTGGKVEHRPSSSGSARSTGYSGAGNSSGTKSKGGGSGPAQQDKKVAVPSTKKAPSNAKSNDPALVGPDYPLRCPVCKRGCKTKPGLEKHMRAGCADKYREAGGGNIIEVPDLEQGGTATVQIILPPTGWHCEWCKIEAAKAKGFGEGPSGLISLCIKCAPFYAAGMSSVPVPLPDESYECTNCSQKFKSARGLCSHYKNCIKGYGPCEWCDEIKGKRVRGPSGPHTLCGVCGSRFKAGFETAPIKNPETNKYPCEGCGSEFELIRNLTTHQRYCAGGDWECQWCGLKQNDPALKGRGPGPAGPSTLCSVCASRYRSGYSKPPTKDEDGNYVCDACGFTFNTVRGLGSHVRGCTGGTWRCDWCGADEKAARGKSPGPSGPRTLCSKCGSRFRNGQKERFPRDEQGRVMCDRCGRAFESIVRLAGHRRFCDGGNWRCEWCDSSGDGQSKGPGPNGPRTLCSTCSSRFRGGHTEAPPRDDSGKFFCVDCEKRFDTISGLGSHRRFCTREIRNPQKEDLVEDLLLGGGEVALPPSGIPSLPDEIVGDALQVWCALVFFSKYRGVECVTDWEPFAAVVALESKAAAKSPLLHKVHAFIVGVLYDDLYRGKPRAEGEPDNVYDGRILNGYTWQEMLRQYYVMLASECKSADDELDMAEYGSAADLLGSNEYEDLTLRQRLDLLLVTTNLASRSSGIREFMDNQMTEVAKARAVKRSEYTEARKQIYESTKLENDSKVDTPRPGSAAGRSEGSPAPSSIADNDRDDDDDDDDDDDVSGTDENGDDDDVVVDADDDNDNINSDDDEPNGPSRMLSGNSTIGPARTLSSMSVASTTASEADAPKRKRSHKKKPDSHGEERQTRRKAEASAREEINWRFQQTKYDLMSFRKEPLGYDRNHNSYWVLDSSYDRIWVQEVSGTATEKWTVVRSVGELETLLESLHKQGERESVLRLNIVERKKQFMEAMIPKEKVPADAVSDDVGPDSRNGHAAEAIETMALNDGNKVAEGLSTSDEQGNGNKETEAICHPSAMETTDSPSPPKIVNERLSEDGDNGAAANGTDDTAMDTEDKLTQPNINADDESPASPKDDAGSGAGVGDRTDGNGAATADSSTSGAVVPNEDEAASTGVAKLDDAAEVGPLVVTNATECILREQGPAVWRCDFCREAFSSEDDQHHCVICHNSFDVQAMTDKQFLAHVGTCRKALDKGKSPWLTDPDETIPYSLMCIKAELLDINDAIAPKAVRGWDKSMREHWVMDVKVARTPANLEMCLLELISNVDPKYLERDWRPWPELRDYMEQKAAADTKRGKKASKATPDVISSEEVADADSGPSLPFEFAPMEESQPLPDDFVYEEVIDDGDGDDSAADDDDASDSESGPDQGSDVADSPAEQSKNADDDDDAAAMDVDGDGARATEKAAVAAQGTSVDSDAAAVEPAPKSTDTLGASKVPSPERLASAMATKASAGHASEATEDASSKPPSESALLEQPQQPPAELDQNQKVSSTVAEGEAQQTTASEGTTSTAINVAGDAAASTGISGPKDRNKDDGVDVQSSASAERRTRAIPRYRSGYGGFAPVFHPPQTGIEWSLKPQRTAGRCMLWLAAFDASVAYGQQTGPKNLKRKFDAEPLLMCELERPPDDSAIERPSKSSKK